MLTCALLPVRRILPILAVLFLCSFLDRTNVGNARLYGLEKDINITDHEYDQGLAVFYATYIVRFVKKRKKLSTPQHDNALTDSLSQK